MRSFWSVILLILAVPALRVSAQPGERAEDRARADRLIAIASEAMPEVPDSIRSDALMRLLAAAAPWRGFDATLRLATQHGAPERIIPFLGYWIRDIPEDTLLARIHDVNPSLYAGAVRARIQARQGGSSLEEQADVEGMVRLASKIPDPLERTDVLAGIAAYVENAHSHLRERIPSRTAPGQNWVPRLLREVLAELAPRDDSLSRRRAIETAAALLRYDFVDELAHAVLDSAGSVAAAGALTSSARKADPTVFASMIELGLRYTVEIRDAVERIHREREFLRLRQAPGDSVRIVVLTDSIRPLLRAMLPPPPPPDPSGDAARAAERDRAARERELSRIFRGTVDFDRMATTLDNFPEDVDPLASLASVVSVIDRQLGNLAIRYYEPRPDRAALIRLIDAAWSTAVRLDAAQRDAVRAELVARLVRLDPAVARARADSLRDSGARDRAYSVVGITTAVYDLEGAYALLERMSPGLPRDRLAAWVGIREVAGGRLAAAAGLVEPIADSTERARLLWTLADAEARAGQWGPAYRSITRALAHLTAESRATPVVRVSAAERLLEHEFVHPASPPDVLREAVRTAIRLGLLETELHDWIMRHPAEKRVLAALETLEAFSAVEGLWPFSYPGRAR